VLRPSTINSFIPHSLARHTRFSRVEALLTPQDGLYAVRFRMQNEMYLANARSQIGPSSISKRRGLLRHQPFGLTSPGGSTEVGPS
jgi:hypothetical protein